MPLNPWSHDDFDDEDDLSDRLEAAMRELEELKYLFPTTETFTHLVASDPILGDFALTKGHRRPDKHSCLRYWQILVLDGPTASTAYHMRSCDFCRSTMKDVLSESEQPSLKLLYDRLWTMPLDPTDEEVDQMEALSDLKNALREIEEEDIAARVAERRSSEPPSRPVARSIDETKGVNRRRFIAVVGAAALLIAGAGGHAIWSGIAAPTNNQLYTTPTYNYFRYVDSIYASGGMSAVQAVYAAGTDSEAARVILWVRQRKNPATYSFLVSCMMDPRLPMRSGAVNEALLLPPVDLKPHLLMMQAAHAAETVPSLQSAMAKLILQVQNS